MDQNEKTLQKVPEWTVDEVVNWVKKVGFVEYASVFEQWGVDGDILLLLNDKDIKEDLEMRNGIIHWFILNVGLSHFSFERRKIEIKCVKIIMTPCSVTVIYILAVQ